MNWIKFTPDLEGEMPELELNSPGTVSVWIRTNNPYADRYGVGHYDYETPGWSYDGCAPGFQVTHWAAIEAPEEEKIIEVTVSFSKGNPNVSPAQFEDFMQDYATRNKK